MTEPLLWSAGGGGGGGGVRGGGGAGERGRGGGGVEASQLIQSTAAMPRPSPFCHGESVRRAKPLQDFYFSFISTTTGGRD